MQSYSSRASEKKLTATLNSDCINIHVRVHVHVCECVNEGDGMSILNELTPFLPFSYTSATRTITVECFVEKLRDSGTEYSSPVPTQSNEIETESSVI